MACYTGDDPLTFDSSIAKLKDAFANLLPEIFNRGNQQQFTSLNEAFPCVRASTQTNPALLAQAKLKDQETIKHLNEVLESFQFLETCFQNGLVNREETIVNRDESIAFTCYDLLLSQLLVINQAILCWEKCVNTETCLENLQSKEFSAKVHFYLSKFRNTKESVYAENIENGFQQFEEAKNAHLVSYNVFSAECQKLALMRQKHYDINMSKYTFHNDILWKANTRMTNESNELCSIDEYFSRQNFMWSDALKALVGVSVSQTPQVNIDSSPSRTSQSRSQFETRKFSSNRVALGRLLEEITQEMPKMKLENLRFALKEVQSRHKVVEDLSLDPDVVLGSTDTNVLKESRNLMRTLVDRIESQVKRDKDSDDRRKAEQAANLKALGTVNLPNLTGFGDYLAWKRAQEKLNTHVDDFKKAAVLLNTLKNADDKARCQGIYDFDELMLILKTKYSHQEKLVPALINKLRKLPEPYTDEVMARNIDVILNVYSQLKSISNVAISRFDATVVEDMVLKLTPRYQERYEDFIEDNKSKKGFSVFRFGEEGSEVETVISGASREEDRAPVDNSDTSTVKRNMFLTFIRKTETKLANIAARKVNLGTASKTSQKCMKCKVKPCKCSKKSNSGAYATQVTNGDKACLVCNAVNPHMNRARKPTKCLSACKIFREKDVAERRRLATNLKACHVCLNQGHFSKECPRSYSCNLCKKKHNILLCPEFRKDTNLSQNLKPSAPPLEHSDANMAQHSGAAYLAVSGIKIHDRTKQRGMTYTCLWDSGSTHNFILDEVASRLGYIGHKAVLNLSRVGMLPTPLECTRYYINIISNNGNRYCIQAYGMPNIGFRNPTPPSVMSKFSRMFNISPSMINNQSGQITLLMGMPNLNLHPTDVKTLGTLRLLKSSFGEPYMVIGALKSPGVHASSNFIDASIKDYIVNDSLGLNLPPKCSVCLKAPPCKQCTLLNQPISFKEQEEGKLIKNSMVFDYEKKEVRVSYPYIKDPSHVFPPEKSNYSIASKLATNLRKSLHRDGLYSEYSENWNDMIHRNVIRELSDEEMSSWEQGGNPVNYCSHHAVLKDTKSTKCRIVTNSSLNHNGTSLNAILPKGPNSISNLLHVLLRFRARPYLVIADLSKAYNSIKTSELDAHLRRFLWFGEDGELKTYALTRMHFGDTPSGFYLECAKEEISNYSRSIMNEPVLADKLISESYVDDILPTTNTLEEAQNIANKLPKAFSVLGFKMKECTVNGKQVNHDGNHEPQHLLGLIYHPQEDEIQLKFIVNFSKKKRGQKTCPNLTSSSDLKEVVITKRLILSLLASQYDPLGLASPFLAKLKIFQSRLFKNPNYTGWDTPVNPDDQKYGVKLVRELIIASESSLKFDRSNKPKDFQLKSIVCFSDGSAVAFQCCLYGIYSGPNGKVHTSLLTAKNRVSNETVPRAELNGVVAGTRLVLNYLEAVEEASNVKSIAFLTDSTCVLDFLDNYFISRDIYVINRIMEIRKSVSKMKIPVEFYHIPSKMNVADHGTRSDCTFAYMSSSEWQQGPPFIINLENSSVNLKHTFNTNPDSPESFSMAYTTVAEPRDNWSNLLQTENLQKVLRVWCIVHGIIVNKRFQRKSPTVSDMDRAFKFFVKISQDEKEVQKLKTKQLVIFEKDGILWTKMRFSDDMLKNIFNKEMLPVISPKCKFAKLLLRAAHVSSRIHCSQIGTLMNSRIGRYGVYITHCKQAIKGLINSCVVCRKTSRQTQDAKMGVKKGGFGEVPEDGSCFNRLAMDYFGPYMCKPPKGRETRGTKFFKIWGMAVLCQQTRAIKVYPVEGYDTQSFLTVFKTHCALHGVPTSVLSDPMSAFKAASKEVSSTEYDTKSISLQLEEQFNLEWTFIPPGSQWRDPAERSIKSIKQMLDSVFCFEKDKPVLTLNEYWCVFSEISEMLNRRPIQGAVFEGSLRMICPNDLILGRTSKDQPSTLPESMDNRKRLQLIQDYKSEFWKVMINIFASDSRLFKYPTWYKQTRKPVIGDIVLVLYKSKMKDNFKIAKIENVSTDGRNLDLTVSPYQDSSITNFKMPVKMNVPTQRTILLYSPTTDNDENCD